MFRNRKAMVFNIMIVIFTITILVYAFIRLSAKMNSSKEIGVSEFDLVAKIQEGEKAMIFLDSAAKMAIYQAVYDLQAQGGIKEASSCGTYFSFNKWNDQVGQTCFVDSATAKDSLRDLFVSDLVARVAAYPNADFIGYVPEAAVARGAALGAAPPAGVSVPAPSQVACKGGSDVKIDFMFDSPYLGKDKNSRIWIPAEANCAGSYPLVVFLHGNGVVGEPLYDGFGDGKSKDHIPIAKKLITSGKMQPVILAAPHQTTFPGLPNGAKISGPNLWKGFNARDFVDEVKKNLPQGVSISSVSFTGFSGAGCGTSGIYRAAADIPELYAIGQFDTCTGLAKGSLWKSRLGSSTKLLIMYGSMIEKGDTHVPLNVNKNIDCPQTEIPGAILKNCFSDESGKYFAFTTSYSHEKGKTVGFEQFFKMFFPAQDAAQPAASEKVTESQEGVS